MPDTQTSTGRRATLRLAVSFTVLVLAVAYAAPLLGGSPAAPGPGFVLWGAAPLLAALGLRIATRDWSGAGLRPAIRRNGRWYLLSFLAVPVVQALVLLGGAAGSITSLSGFSARKYLLVAATALAAFLVTAFFEEFGWRGYLGPKLAALGIDGHLGHAVVGVVWAAWHLPFLRGFGWMYGAEGLRSMVPRFFLVSIALSMVYGEIRAITGTLWPAVLMHSAGNAFAHPLAAEYLRVDDGWEFLGSISTGLPAAVCFALLGIALHRWRTRREASAPPPA